MESEVEMGNCEENKKDKKDGNGRRKKMEKSEVKRTKEEIRKLKDVIVFTSSST